MSQIKQRLVFYVSGFDPSGDERYYRLYRDESAKQAAVNGMNVEVGGREYLSPLATRWRVLGRTANGQVQTEYVFLHWDDIVRKHWARTALGTFADTVRASWAMIRYGHLVTLYRLHWPFANGAATPIGMLLASLLLFLAGLMVGRALLAAWGAAPGYGWAAGILLGMGVALPAILFYVRNQGAWIGRLIAFNFDIVRGAVPQLESRVGQFATLIREWPSRREADETLIVGHSFGAEVAISTLARLADQAPDIAVREPTFALLTLGQTTPCRTSLWAAEPFSHDVLRVAAMPGLTWTDFSAPSDPACFPFIDPVAAAGLARPPGAAIQPKLLSPRFHKLFTPETYARLWRNHQSKHFMYLKATELAGEFDYFAITAGDRRLADRYAHLSTVTNFTRFKRKAA